MNQENLDKFLSNYLNIHSPGYVIEVFKNNKIEEYIIGNKSVKPKKLKVSKDTLYDIASITKVFTSVLIYKAYEENLINLNESVYLIDNNYKNLNNITILDLLSHNQEIYTNGYLGDAKDKDEFYKILYSSYVKDKTPKYIDVHYIILSDILEKIYSKSYSEIIKEKIVNKIGLSSLTFMPKSNIASCNYEYQNDVLKTDLKLGMVHDKKARRARELGLYTGHAGIFITGKDLLLFLKSFFDCSILKKETIELMLMHKDIYSYNLNLLKKLAKDNKDVNKLYDMALKNNKDLYIPLTYNNMGCRYKNKIKALNDVPDILSDNSITFSGFTGPMFVIDFDKKVIVLVMCNLLHLTKLERKMRKNMTTKIITYILDNILKR